MVVAWHRNNDFTWRFNFNVYSSYNCFHWFICNDVCKGLKKTKKKKDVYFYFLFSIKIIFVFCLLENIFFSNLVFHYWINCSDSKSHLFAIVFESICECREFFSFEIIVCHASYFISIIQNVFNAVVILLLLQKEYFFEENNSKSLAIHHSIVGNQHCFIIIFKFNLV